MTWDGKERRGMDKDWLERDRILSEVHSDVKHLVDWCKSHEYSDNERFKLANIRIGWIEKVAYVGIGGLGVLSVILKLIH